MTPSEPVPDEIDTPRPKAAVQFPVIPWALWPLPATVVPLANLGISERIAEGHSFDMDCIFGLLFLVSAAWSAAWIVQQILRKQPSVPLLLLMLFWAMEALRLLPMPPGTSRDGLWHVSLATGGALSAWFVVLLIRQALGVFRRPRT